MNVRNPAAGQCLQVTLRRTWERPVLAPFSVALRMQELCISTCPPPRLRRRTRTSCTNSVIVAFNRLSRSQGQVQRLGGGNGRRRSGAEFQISTKRRCTARRPHLERRHCWRSASHFGVAERAEPFELPDTTMPVGVSICVEGFESEDGTRHLGAVVYGHVQTTDRLAVTAPLPRQGLDQVRPTSAKAKLSGREWRGQPGRPDRIGRPGRVWSPGLPAPASPWRAH